MRKNGEQAFGQSLYLLVLALSIGLYFAWTSVAHYSTVFGFSARDDIFLSAVASLTSAILYALVFFMSRRDLMISFSMRNNALFLILGLCGLVLEQFGLGGVVTSVFKGLWVAWFRLALVVNLVMFSGKSIMRCVGVSFLVCAAAVGVMLAVPEAFVQGLLYLIPLVLFVAVAYVGKAGHEGSDNPSRFAPIGSLWKIVLFAFAFSILFDVTETHLFFSQETFDGIGIPLGFVGVAVLVISLASLFAIRRNLMDTLIFTTAVCLAFIGSTGYFLSDVIDYSVIQGVVQITCGYGFVCLLIIAAAEISKRHAVAPCMLFSLVFCVQRIGNYVGELVGFGFMVDSPLPHSWVNAIGSITIVFCFAVILVVFVSMNGKLTLFEKGLVGAEDEDARSMEIEALKHFAEEWGLTKREVDVFLLLVSRYSRKEIEKELFLSANTIKTHTGNIYRKLEVHSQSELIEFVHIRQGSEQQA